MKRTSLEVQPVFWLFAVLAVVVIPIKWVAAWAVSVAFHELGHYITLRLLDIPVISVSIECSGARMYTAAITATQEILVAAMGPAFSLILVLSYRLIPHIACCAFVLLFFNLLPFSAFDGNRILVNCLHKMMPSNQASVVLWSLRCLIIITVIIVAVQLRWYILLAGAVVVLCRTVTFPCKRRKQIVQWSK